MGLGTRKFFSTGLYQKDAGRLQAVCKFLEEQNGRPASATTALIYLLDRFDEWQRINEIVRKEEVNVQANGSPVEVKPFYKKGKKLE